MTLPKIDLPTFEITLPVSKIKLDYRPFLVKEQKILLMASENEELDFLSKNIKQILQNCCLSDIKIETLPSVDVEYYFLHLRARSVGETVNTRYRCENYIKETESVCGHLMDVTYNILDTKVFFEENFSDTINLTDTIGIKLKVPEFKSVERFTTEDSSEIEAVFDIIKSSIEYIFDENNFYYRNEMSDADLDEFIESLNVNQFNKIRQFFKQLPTLKEIIHVKCGKCGFEHEIVIQGLNNFFD